MVLMDYQYFRVLRHLEKFASEDVQFAGTSMSVFGIREGAVMYDASTQVPSLLVVTAVDFAACGVRLIGFTVDETMVQVTAFIPFTTLYELLRSNRLTRVASVGVPQSASAALSVPVAGQEAA